MVLISATAARPFPFLCHESNCHHPAAQTLQLTALGTEILPAKYSGKTFICCYSFNNRFLVREGEASIYLPSRLANRILTFRDNDLRVKAPSIQQEARYPVQKSRSPKTAVFETITSINQNQLKTPQLLRTIKINGSFHTSDLLFFLASPPQIKKSNLKLEIS